MPFSFSDVAFDTRLPDIPAAAPVAVHSAPCLKDSERPMRALARAFGLNLTGVVDVPHGRAVGGQSGQVEVFAASGAVRARNTDQLSRYGNERRDWRDLVRDEDGSYRLGEGTAKHLTGQALGLLDGAGLLGDHAGVTVSLGQWALLDEKGTELESGPGRATVQLSYAADGLPLIGAGAKTNIHLDPDPEGGGGVLARFFHVHRATESMREVRTLPLEKAFDPLLTARWSGLEVDPASSRMTVTAVTVGLLALPADQPQGFAAPALAVEGRVEGAVGGDGRELTVQFGRYLALAHPRDLAEAGLASSGPLVRGQVVRGRARGQ